MKTLNSLYLSLSLVVSCGPIVTKPIRAQNDGADAPPRMASLEVLRGPQGTLFGKNVVGGALGMITAKPQVERRGSVYVGVGDYDQIQSGGHLTSPISGDAAWRFAFYQSCRDG